MKEKEEIGIEPQERDSCRGYGQVIESKVLEFSLFTHAEKNLEEHDQEKNEEEEFREKKRERMKRDSVVKKGAKAIDQTKPESVDDDLSSRHSHKRLNKKNLQAQETQCQGLSSCHAIIPSLGRHPNLTTNVQGRSLSDKLDSRGLKSYIHTFFRRDFLSAVNTVGSILERHYFPSYLPPTLPR
ncbi:hypothetical protein SDJN03_17097, partial [Cucurbita argyrosperma subsp. sororia]